MGTTAQDVRLARGGETLEISLLVYSNVQAAQADWDLVTGQAPQLKAGRSVPAHSARWWNTNAIAIVKTAGTGIRSDAFNAFISI